MSAAGCICPTRLDDDGNVGIAPDTATCGACGRSWCDRCNPTPAARCLFEYEHAEEEAPSSTSSTRAPNPADVAVLRHAVRSYDRAAEQVAAALTRGDERVANAWRQDRAVEAAILADAALRLLRGIGEAGDLR
jgi:hypothetical protein